MSLFQSCLVFFCLVFCLHSDLLLPLESSSFPYMKDVLLLLSSPPEERQKEDSFPRPHGHERSEGEDNEKTGTDAMTRNHEKEEKEDANEDAEVSLLLKSSIHSSEASENCAAWGSVPMKSLESICRASIGPDPITAENERTLWLHSS